MNCRERSLYVDEQGTNIFFLPPLRLYPGGQVGECIGGRVSLPTTKVAWVEEVVAFNKHSKESRHHGFNCFAERVQQSNGSVRAGV